MNSTHKKHRFNLLGLALDSYSWFIIAVERLVEGFVGLAAVREIVILTFEGLRIE